MYLNSFDNHRLPKLTGEMFDLILHYDICTAMHSWKVEQLAVEIARKFNFSSQGIQDMATAGLLHDIGKIKIPKAILNKPDKLTEAEFAVIKEHPGYGFHILDAITPLKNIAETILYHHEKFDGTGYPAGKKNKEIPLTSQILSIADVYDAITSNRVYRKAMTTQDAVQFIIDHKNTHFDPELVDVFLTLPKGVLNFEFL